MGQQDHFSYRNYGFDKPNRRLSPQQDADAQMTKHTAVRMSE
jgi:hypothetical protein